MTPDWIQLRIGEIDRRLAHLSEGRQILEQLRDGYERLLALSDTPDQVPGPTGSEGSPAPAPTLSSRVAGAEGPRMRASSAAATAGSLTCPECGTPAKSAGGLGVHRARRHGVAGAARAPIHVAPSPQEEPIPERPVVRALGADVDRRNIDEECPRGCGRRFRWEPSLLSHVRSCKGKAEAVAGGGSSMTPRSDSALIEAPSA